MVCSNSNHKENRTHKSIYLGGKQLFKGKKNTEPEVYLPNPDADLRAEIGERPLNKGRVYFKVRGIIQMKYENFVIFAQQIATIIIYSLMYYSTASTFHCFIVCVLLPYAF